MLRAAVVRCVRQARPRPFGETAQCRGFGAFAGNFVREKLSNGILDQDDYYRRGIPPSLFKLQRKPEEAEVTRETLLKRVFAANSHVDPFALAATELRSVSESVQEVIGSDHPVLERVASYFFDVKGKRVRPTIVLLMSGALSHVTRPAVAPVAASTEAAPAQAGASRPLRAPSLATSPFFPAPTATSGAAETKATARRDASTTGIGSISAAQRRLSEITEMIHTASLLHDDVIDEADTRRGVPSVNQMFGNKLAILGGDFLLARASVALARLRNPDVVELLSTVVEHLVKGEVMQMRNARGDAFSNVDLYLTKSFYKTASLMANSCRAAAMLAGLDSRTCDVSFEYGKHIGLTFQLVDDLLDFVGTDGSLGKPAQHDLAQGVVTLPVLYAAQEFPELNTLIGRGFKSMGDVERGLELVRRSSAIDKARETAWSCAEGAVAAAMQLPASHARAALISLVDKVLTRDR